MFVAVAVIGVLALGTVGLRTLFDRIEPLPSMGETEPALVEIPIPAQTREIGRGSSQPLLAFSNPGGTYRTPRAAIPVRDVETESYRSLLPRGVRDDARADRLAIRRSRGTV